MKIRLQGFQETGQVYLNDKELDPRPSQKRCNHSPDGFNWGYAGSGPAQLALAICMHLDLNMPYQDFKNKYIATLPFGKSFDLILDIEEKVSRVF